jgi:polyether ionophore transport system permease protein
MKDRPMQPERLGVDDRRAAAVIAVRTAKRAARSAAVWGALFGVLVANEALSYHSTFPTAASRETFARTFGHNAAFDAIIGSARRLDTVGGAVAWRVFGLLVIVGAVWGLLAATRQLRKEEDAGRWELLLAGQTTRRHATAQAIAGLAVGWIVLWALTAAFTIAAGSRPTVGFSAAASLFYATAATASAAIFLAIGAVCSQLATTHRQANGLGAAAFAVFFLVRMVADSVSGLGWMRWLSPLGWVENLHPLTGSQPLVLLPIVLFITSGAMLAMSLAARRDIGTGILVRHRSSAANTRLLGGPLPLVIRLERWVALAWIGGLALLALIFGVVARSAATGSAALNKSIVQQVGRLGGHHASAAEAWIGYEFLYIAALVAFAAAGQISAMRSEEADGHLENLLARYLNRDTWALGRLGFGATFVVVSGLAVGIGGWIGVASRQSGVGFTPMLQAGLNTMPAALFVLGIGMLLYGLVPRFAAPLLYALVLWSFLIEIVGSSITSNQLLLDTALLSQLGPVPAASLNWTAIGVLAGFGLLTALAGLSAFRRRDLIAA